MNFTKKPKIGLLPFYLSLYDTYAPNAEPDMLQNAENAKSALEAAGLEVFAAPICRVERQFNEAIAAIEQSGAAVIVTLHLAYSPSLESLPALLSSKLPIIALDITPEYHFGARQNSADIMENHGIHGVQDMCSMLRRHGRRYYVEAGHIKDPEVISRVVKRVYAICAAFVLKNTRVGTIGKPFVGMGDFYAAPEHLRDTLGIEVIDFDFNDAQRLLSAFSDKDVSEEMACYKNNYNITKNIKRGDFENTARASLMVRKWIEENRLNAFTFNFTDITRECGVPTVPFIEASVCMSKGIGYAGEGDTMTASLVGALLSAYKKTTFAEMFCPCWDNDTIFLSHMGEVNFAVCESMPDLALADFPYTNAEKPLVAYGRMRAGKAVFVNLAIGPRGYELIFAPVCMLPPSDSEKLRHTVQGWFKHTLSAARFLEEYSYAGGTHHGAVVYGAEAYEIKTFGEILGFNITEIS